MSKHVKLDHDVNTAVGFNANFTFKYISLVVIYVCLTFKNQWPVNICIFVHTEKLFSVCLINVTVLKCLLLPYRKVTGQVLRRICGSCFISPPPWCQQTGMNLDSLNMVEEQEGKKKKKYRPGWHRSVFIEWLIDWQCWICFTNRLKWLCGLELTHWLCLRLGLCLCVKGVESWTSSTGQPGSMMDALLIDINTENHDYLWCTRYGCS